MVSAYRQNPDERELNIFQKLSRREQQKTIASYQHLHDKGFGDHSDLVGKLKQHVKPNHRTIVAPKDIRAIVAALVGVASIGLGTYAVVKYLASEEKKDSFVQCLVDNDVKVYTAHWPSIFQSLSVSQEQLFADQGIDIKEIKVECYDPSPEYSPEYSFVKQCGKNMRDDLLFFPSWNIHGAKVDGLLSLEQVATYSGCKYNP